MLWLFCLAPSLNDFTYFISIMQTDPDFDLEIQGDVEEECSKYGRVKHIYVDK